LNFDYTRGPEAARALAGCALVGAGFLSLMGIITAEALYPEPFATGANEISDLAGLTEEGTVLQPSAGIFNVAMAVSGLLLLASAYGLHRGLGVARVTRLVGLLGAGTLGVGLFPEYYADAHRIFAGMTFVAGGLAAVAASQVVARPFSFVSGTLGVIALIALDVVIFGKAFFIYQDLGPGGVERWVAYPIILWQIAFGSYLLGGRGVVTLRHPRVTEAAVPPAAP
jgi:hypothetical membrane protein